MLSALVEIDLRFLYFPDNLPPRIPPCRHGPLLLVLPEVRSRRRGCSSCTPQFDGPRRDVQLLPSLRVGSEDPEVFVVEEVCYEDAVGKFRIFWSWS